LATQATDEKVLSNFYKKTRPFGFWSKIRAQFSDEFISKINSENRRDIFSIFFAVPWQCCLFLMWLMFAMKRFDNFFILLILTVILSVILYLSWFRHLSTEVKEEKEKQV